MLAESLRFEIINAGRISVTWTRVSNLEVISRLKDKPRNEAIKLVVTTDYFIILARSLISSGIGTNNEKQADFENTVNHPFCGRLSKFFSHIGELPIGDSNYKHSNFDPGLNRLS